MTQYTCGFSHVYLQSFLLHDIRAFFATYICVLSCFVGFLFPSIWPFSYKGAYICAQKKPTCMRYKQACGIWGHRKSSYKRHRNIPSEKNPFMYDGAEKWLQFESAMAALISSKAGSYSLMSSETRRLRTCSWRRKGDNSREREKRRKIDLFKQTVSHYHTSFMSRVWPVGRSFLTESIVVSVSIREIAYTVSQETIHGFQQIHCRGANNNHYCEGNEEDPNLARN